MALPPSSSSATPPKTRYVVGSPVDARAAAAGELEYLGLASHGRVTRRGHRQRAVRGAVFNGGLQRLAGQESIDQSGREGVAAADAVEDLQTLAVGGLHDTGGGGPGDGTPVVDAGRTHGAHRGGDDLEVRVCRSRLLDHRGELTHLQGRKVLVHALDLEPEARTEVLLVANHHVDVPGDLAVDLLGPGLTADRLPQAGAVVEVVGHDGAVTLRRGDRLDDRLRSRLAEGSEDPSGVQPAHPELAEQV